MASWEGRPADTSRQQPLLRGCADCGRASAVWDEHDQPLCRRCRRQRLEALHDGQRVTDGLPDGYDRIPY